MGLWGDKHRPLTPRDGFDHDAWVDDVLEEAEHATLREYIAVLGEVPEPNEDYGTVDAARDMLTRLWDHIDGDLCDYYENLHGTNSAGQQIMAYTGGVATMILRLGRYHAITQNQWLALADREMWGRNVWQP